MPFIRVRVRPKDGQQGSASADGPGPGASGSGGQTPAPVGRQNDSGGSRQPRSGTSAFVAGALVGLLALAVVSAVFLVRRSGGAEVQGTADVPVATAASGAELPTGQSPSAEVTPEGQLGWVDTRTGPSPINAEFNLEDPIAYVNDDVIAMRDLDRSVRVSRVLATLSGEPIPANDEPEFREFQIRMLKRLVDMQLMAQGALEAGLPIPEGDTAPVVDGFLQEVGATRDELNAAMSVHAVSPEELHRWFSDARTAQYFVTESLAADGQDDPAASEQLTQDWLRNAWATQTILINFYEPEQ